MIEISRERAIFMRTFGTETTRQVRPVSVLKDATETYWELLLAHRKAKGAQGPPTLPKASTDPRCTTISRP
ncbi:hypothetical protein EDD27_0699 [Nonomuraea polychroma]|uniref:Uncharacterized protein n=1 Tax=Nonomuraea polychroma TaxID=46176 RepID=A0A438LXX9_9ACTN|nr:hypothetical protein [Nonomuraea polychroma]RVX38394.1 hypothetical protein EDD27_0699 [Nonomuraea polychroma]